MYEQILAWAGVTTGVAAIAGAMMLVSAMVVVVFYVYYALVLMTIAKKLNVEPAWLAWIPVAQLAMFPMLAKKKASAWPWVFILLIPIVNFVFLIIWTWKIFENRKYPGALSLVVIASIIPFVGWLANLANLVIWGFVAWKDR